MTADRLSPQPPGPIVTQTESDGAHAAVTMGQYRLLQKLGEGGMGEVWLAEQTEPVRRQVAFKVIKLGMDSTQVIARFEAERQALALMAHPIIATVFDGGTTPEGRPYFAMEYVKGEPITTYCDRHKLPVAERLALILQVCEGVQHAHQKGIIHRDLKPSNVLVTIQNDQPTPRIIDFGVAKATTQHLTERTLFTELGVLIGTPEYMSPEQAEMGGLDIDTRTDVYALGVLLYELLTGALPFEPAVLREAGLDEIRRTIREKDPPRPSTRVTQMGQAVTEVAQNRQTDSGRLASELRGDLDWIAMKALEKDRTRRYGSASDLAADIRRHLENQPVLASPPSTLYRMQKFVRRHGFGVAAAATLVLVLMTFATAMTVQAQRIGRERDRANREAAGARAVSDFVVGLFKLSNPDEAKGRTVTAREILSEGAGRIDQSLRDQPEVRARLQTTMGNAFSSLGLYADAKPLLQQALETYRQVLGNDHPDTLAALFALAEHVWHEQQYHEAETLYLEVVERRTRVLGETHRDTLDAAAALAATYVMAARNQEAEQLLLKVLEQQRSVLGENARETLGSMNNLQALYFKTKRFPDALTMAQRVLEGRRLVLGGEHPETITAMHNLGTIYQKLDRDAEAEPLFLELIERRRRVQGEYHPSTSNSRRALGGMYHRQRRFGEAEPILLSAYEGVRRTYGEDHQRTHEAVKDLVALYDDWSKPRESALWRKKLPFNGK